MTYDDWKTANPYDEEKDNECSFCGTPTDNKYYCSKDCEKAAYYD